ncbi:MAG: TonB-dependent receptor [Verrucomicrobia bacterium]|nr:TonB-dependent receptor [Verrucomicrobiota bacterium]
MSAAADKLSNIDRTDTQRIPPGGTPGYRVASLRGGWQPTDALRLTIALENMTNQDYRIHGSGLNMPGFGALISLEYTF